DGAGREEDVIVQVRARLCGGVRREAGCERQDTERTCERATCHTILHASAYHAVARRCQGTFGRPSASLRGNRRVDTRRDMGTFVVTGSGSGIGAAVRRRLERDGGTVVGVDLRDAEITAD